MKAASKVITQKQLSIYVRSLTTVPILFPRRRPVHALVESKSLGGVGTRLGLVG